MSVTTAVRSHLVQAAEPFTGSAAFVLFGAGISSRDGLLDDDKEYEAMSSAFAPTGAFTSLEERADEYTLPCAVDPDLWFAESPAELEQAKRLCGRCPVRESCLAGAIERQEPWGVWGGEIFEHGSVVPGKRGRGRPRKHPSAGTRDPAA